MEGAERLLGEQGVRRWSARSVSLRSSETLLGRGERRLLSEKCKKLSHLEKKYIAIYFVLFSTFCNFAN